MSPHRSTQAATAAAVALLAAGPILMGPAPPGRATVFVDEDAAPDRDGSSRAAADRFPHIAWNDDPGAGIGRVAAGHDECGTTLTPEEAARALMLEQAGAYELPDGVALGVPVEVPLTFHVVRTSDGTGGVTEDQLAQAIVDADAAFASMGISFCLPGPTIYIDSDAFYYDIDTIAEINALRTTNPVLQTINIYFTENLAYEGGSLCGISAFTFSAVQGIAMANACTGTPSNPTTFPHEIGHYFDLYHTHETMFDVECVDGSNCDVAGDLLCDTPADPNLGGQVTNPPDCLYTGGEAGPCVGDPPYDPDTTNLMSYSQKVCRDNFSPQQEEKALATLLNLRPELVDACECPATPAARVYVDAGVLAGGDGTSWESPFTDLQQALEVAACPINAVTEIWVAAGAYTPAPPGGARTATFRLVPGVEMYGHFAGSESSVEERDLANPAYETVLSGDLNGDDGPGPFDNNAENSYSVVTGSATSATAVLDGFTISGGNADGPIDGNLDWVRGAGMWNVFGSPTIRHCRFEGNYADSFGGGIYNRQGSSPVIEDCLFTGNLSGSSGGAMFNFSNSLPQIVACTFESNVATSGSGGAMYNQAGSDLTIDGCSFEGNMGLGGGAIFNNGSSPVVTDCDFTGNAATGSSGGAMFNYDGSSPQISGTSFVNNNSGNYNGGAMSSGLNSHPTVTACAFDGNAGYNGGAMRNYSSSNATIESCTFNGNTAVGQGGAVSNYDDSNTQVTNCRFTNNSAGTRGGAMRDGRSCSSTWTNCTFNGNSAAGAGGAISAGSDGTPIGHTRVADCILWGNTAPLGAEIALIGGQPAEMTVSYSDVEGGQPGVYVQAGFTLNWGAGNIDMDPMFADADLRLSPGSPCIDAADNTAVPMGVVSDLDGNPRFQDDPATADTGNGPCPIVDMGSYELPSTCPWDLDCSGSVGTSDLLELLSQWGSDPGGPPDFDGDGNVGTADLLKLLSSWGPCPGP